MKRVLLEEESGSLRYYKVNLHCHTTISDGRLSPEEVKELYKSHGYSAVAFTDHEIFLTHNDLTDEAFVALNGTEYELKAGTNEDVKNYRRRCHLCFVALSPDTVETPVYASPKTLWGNAKNFKDQAVYGDKPDFDRAYTAEKINEMIRIGRDEGFFVTYNHPVWSGENYPLYSRYEGMHAMEIVNGHCVQHGFDDHNSHAYSDFLLQGKKIYCIATDDNHNGIAPDNPKFDSFAGYVRIAAPALSYKDLTDSLLAGRFYAGTGDMQNESPRFESIVFDEETREVTVKCSPAHAITKIDECVAASSNVKRAPWGESISEASFKVGEEISVIRFVLEDERGFKSYTNAYYLDGRPITVIQ